MSMSENEKTQGWGAKGGAILWGSDQQNHVKVAGVMGQSSLDPICKRTHRSQDQVDTERRRKLCLAEFAALAALDDGDLRFVRAEVRR